MSALHRVFLLAAGAGLILAGRVSGEEPAQATAQPAACAPWAPSAPDVVERRCLHASGEVPHFVARDLSVHLPADRGCALELSLRVNDSSPAVRLVVGPHHVEVPGGPARFVGPGALTVSLSGEQLTIDSGGDPRELSRVADRVGRLAARTRGGCEPTSIVVDRLGS